MAIYHLHASIVQRSKGMSAVASAAYFRAADLFDERLQKLWAYRFKEKVMHSELLVPSDAPAWAKAFLAGHAVDPTKASENFWNKVETAEKRKDAQVARAIEFSLPVELTLEQQIILAKDFIFDQFVLRGMIADWSVHANPGNPHVHVLLTMRPLKADSFGKRALEWNQKSLLFTWRQKWSEYANFHLAQHAHTIRIDHRSYKDQGIDLIPGVHRGKAVSDMLHRNIARDVAAQANAICRQNLVRISKNPQVILDKLTAQSDSFTYEQLGQELGRYINDRGRFSTLNSRTISDGINSSEKGILAHEMLKKLSTKETSHKPLTSLIITKIFASIEAQASVFSEKDMAKALAPFTDYANEFIQAILQIKASPDLLFLGLGADGKERFTTRRLFAVENKLQQVAQHMHKRPHVFISDRRVQHLFKQQEKCKGWVLTSEQKDGVRHLIAPVRLRCLVGRAGTGKSFSLKMAKVIWEAQGLRVQGVALSGIASEALQRESGIASATLQSFCYRLAQGHLALHPHDVVVLDEAGMVDSISLLALISFVQKASAKLVLVGDPAQLQPIGPGATFRALLERVGYAELHTVYRQVELWQRKATKAFARGEVADGLAAYAKRHCLHFEPSAQDVMNRLVKDWQRLWLSEKDKQLMVIAHRNTDVTLLNTLLRAERVAQGEIVEGYPVATSQGDLLIAQGDRLLFLKNNRVLGVSNGRFATVEALAFMESGRIRHFTVRLEGSNKKVVVNPQDYTHFTYGYAATVHKAQGMTIDYTFVYTEGYFWNRHLTYVAMSRHRQECQIYVNQAVHSDQQALSVHLGRLGLKDSVLDYPLAFAARRGIRSKNNLAGFTQHLAKRLAAFQKPLLARFERLCLLASRQRTGRFSDPLENLSLETILMRYVAMEIEQTRLTERRYTERAISFKAGKQASTEAVAHYKALSLFVAAITVKSSAVILALSALPKRPRLSLEERGGFKSIYARMVKGEWLIADKEFALRYLRNRAREESRSQQRDQRRRGGRSL